MTPEEAIKKLYEIFKTINVIAIANNIDSEKVLGYRLGEIKILSNHGISLTKPEE